MNISNINTSNAYTINESVKPPVDNTLLKNQNQTPPEANLNQETSRQQAFKVDITQEARQIVNIVA